MNWHSFELEIKTIFELFGYDVDHNTEIQSAETDLFAKSSNIFKPNLFIESKYSKTPQTLGINEVENFMSRVINLRAKGHVDQGYLITNRKISRNAKGAIREFQSFCHLIEFKKLESTLVDTEYYLKNYINTFKESGLHNRYLELLITTVRETGEINFKHSIEIISALKNSEKIDINKITQNKRLEIYKTNNIIGVSDNINSFIESNINFYILLGDFGSGKTTTLSYMMYELCKRKISNYHDHTIRIPLLINLRNYNKAPDFESLLINFFQTKLGYTNLNISIFRKMNREGKFIIILDGFDEMARLVTAYERKMTFKNLATILCPRSKIILSSRPNYFPDDDELITILDKFYPDKDEVRQYYDLGNYKVNSLIEIASLQLLDDYKLEKYISKIIDKNVSEFGFIFENKSFQDLSSRPVLINMIIESVNELRNLETLNIRSLYDIYTNKWIEREEEKGDFRILIDKNSKLKFITLLALQLHNQDELEIHFSNLDNRIQNYFNLDNQKEVDNFSHDIRTCSFLNRSKGYYKFIHKSFQEYFIAREFDKFERTDFAGFKFSRPINTVIFSFLQQDFIPEDIEDLISQINQLNIELDMLQRTYRFNDIPKWIDKITDKIKLLHSGWPYKTRENTTGNMA